MRRRLHYSPEALTQLETYLVERAGPEVADAYLDRLLDFCDGLATDPVVGHHRDDLLLCLPEEPVDGNRSNRPSSTIA